MCKICEWKLILVPEGQLQHHKTVFNIYTNVNIDETQKSFGSDSTHPNFLNLSFFLDQEYIRNIQFYDDRSLRQRKLKIEAREAGVAEEG